MLVQFSLARNESRYMKSEPIVVDAVMIDAARRVLPVFDGARVTKLRELLALSQREVAEEVGISPSALSQIESKGTRPSAKNLARLAAAFDVLAVALAEQPAHKVTLRPQFRHLRRTSKREQRRAAQLVEATVRVAEVLRSDVGFPEPFDLSVPIDPDAPIELVAHRVENAAAVTRETLGIPALEPLGESVVEILEAGGITIVRDPETDANIDAYSAIVGDLPVIVLDGGSGSVWDRDNFNLAHELGHLVMHQGIEHLPGTKSVEAQAHRFAGAFLGPAPALRLELPDTPDWQRYLQLKRRWGLSMAALVHRAKDLKVMDQAMYTRAMKQRSAHGWRRLEPGSDDRSLPEPTYLARAAALADLPPEVLGHRAHLPEHVVERIVGRAKPSLV